VYGVPRRSPNLILVFLVVRVVFQNWPFDALSGCAEEIYHSYWVYSQLSSWLETMVVKVYKC
jgi:hypothetical protein